MATKSKKSAGGRLGFSIFLISSLLVVLTAGSALVATFLERGQALASLSQELRRSHSAQAVLQQKQLRRLELAARLIDKEGLVAEGLAVPEEEGAEANLAPLAEQLADYRQQLGLDLLLVLDPSGRVVAGGQGNLATGDEGPSGQALFDAAGEKKSASGIWYRNGVLYHAVLIPLVRDFNLLGHVVVAASFRGMEEEIARSTGAQIVYLADTGTGPSIVSTSLDEAHASDVVGALRLAGEALGRVGRGETVEGAELRMDGRPWVAFLSPLRDAGEKPLGAMVALVEADEQVPLFQQVRYLPVAVGAVAVVLAFFVAMLLARSAFKPMDRLAAAAREVSRGNYGAEIPRQGSFAGFGMALAGLADRLGDKDALESYVRDLARHLPEPAKVEALVEPVAQQVVLLVVEVRRFTNPKAAYDPEENVSRLARDLRRVTASVEGRQGTLRSVAGHRLLATFEGEGATMRALTAATEVLLILTTRENAFDEPAAPVIALAAGPAILGSLTWSGRRGAAVIGLPVAQIETQLREATPGEIYISKAIAGEISPAVQQAGLQLHSQRAHLSPQPLYLLKAENAQRLTGATPPAQQPTDFSGTARTLADVVPGVVLGNRFEILAELGSGLHGVTFKAQDRDRGDLVAIKLLRPELWKDEARVEPLRQGLNQARLVSHPHVLNILDLGDADGMAYTTAPFLHAMSLAWMLRQRSVVPIRAAFLIAHQILEALRAAHQTPAVHAGLKPENVLLDASGVKVMDFSLNLGMGAEVRDQPIAGAPYLAPEQIGGRASASTDIYAWGAVFYTMVAGRPPAEGSTPSQVEAQRRTAPRPTGNREVPPELERIIQRALALSPGERYSSAAEILNELDALRG